MPIVEIQGLGNVEFPDTMSQEDIVKAIQSNIMPKIQATQPAVTQVGQPVSPTALTPPPPAQTQDALSGAFGRGLYNTAANIDLLLGKTGASNLPGIRDLVSFHTPEEAEKRAKELNQWGSKLYKDTEQGWSEAPGTKIAELFGGSLPYMMAPAAAAMVTPAAAIGLGVTAADIAAGLVSATQFTGSNLARQTENEKKTLAEASLLNAGLSAIPQAALDVVGLKFIPGVRRLFGEAGQKITEEAAEQLVKKSILAKAGSVALQTGKTMGVEGATEAAQQLFERLQAGLSLTDADARKEYYDNFIGGAVLGGVMAGPGIGLEKMIDTNKKTEEQQLKDLIKELDNAEKGELKGSYNVPPETTTPPADGVPPTTQETIVQPTPPQPNVVTPEQLLSHATTRLQELEIKVAGTETTPPEPLTPQEESELNFLKEHQANPEKLAEGYNVSIGKPQITGSQDIEGALSELDGKPIEVPPIFQPPVETTPPVETKPAEPTTPTEPEAPPTPKTPPTEETPPVETQPAEPGGTATPETPPVEETPPDEATPEEKPPVEETAPVETKPEAKPPVEETPPQTQGAIVKDSNGTEHPLPTIADAEKNGAEYSPINRDKPMYVKTDLDGVFGMIYRLFKENTHPYITGTTTKVTSNKNATLPKTSNKNQISVTFRPDTLSGRQLNDNEFMSYDTAHKAIESFTIYNPSSRLRVAGIEARLGVGYLDKFFNRGLNTDGSITYTLKRVKSQEEKQADDERLSKEYLEHINRSRGKLKHKYTRKRKPGLNPFQKSINQHETLGSALKDILTRLEKAITNNEYEMVFTSISDTEKFEEYAGKDPALFRLSKPQIEMYVEIIKHLMKIDPVMKAHVFMDPYIVGGKYNSTLGFYRRTENILALFANADLSTLVHEGIHAATHHYITMHPNDAKVQKLNQLLQASRKNDKKIRGKWKNYGNTDLDEFIAEAFSDVDFIKHLKAIDPVFDKSEATSIFDNIKTIVGNMMKAMGINVNKDRSVFDEVMDLSSDLFTGKTLEGYRYDAGHPLDADTESQAPEMTEEEAQTEQQTRQVFNYRGDPVDIRKWEIPERGKIATVLSKWFQQWADEHVTITKVQNAIKSVGQTISDMSDAEKKQELKNSRISDQLLRFANEEVNPILKEMLANNVSLEDIKQYLHARHAEAYNNRMNDINHRVDAQGNIIPYDKKDRASGMTTQDANNYLNNLDPERTRILESVADKWYAIRDKTQELLVESGQETQETIDLWKEIFPDYVPLNREQEQQAVPTGMRTGAGVDVRGNFSKRAMGSEKAIINPIDAILYQRERAIARAENNNVGKSVYRLALENPNPDFWMAINPDAIHSREKLIQELSDMGYADPEGIADNLMAEPKERYLRKVRESDFVIDPTTGLPIPNSKEVVDARISRNARFGDNVLTLKINGRERYVFFNQKNEDAVTMVRTLKNLDSETLGKFLSLNRFVNHYFGQLYTVLNPVFGIVNGIRDYPFGMANLSTTPIRGKQLQVSAKIFPAMRGIMGVLRQERASDGSANSEWQRIYKEATEAGFQTSNRYAILNTGEDKSYIEQTLKQFTDGNSKKAFRYIIGMTYDFASTIENGVRLAAYQQMREAGYTPQQSASVAKNLTINFDKKGARTGALRSLYLFFNASVRGTVRLAETLSGPSGGRIIAGGILLGVMQAMMVAAAGFKDDDPPEYIKEHNLIIPTGDGKYITIPMPYGLNILPNTGRIFTEYAMEVGKYSDKSLAEGFAKAHAGKKAMAWTNSLFSTFSPFGNQGLSLNALVPSAVEPIVGVGLTNKNSFGQTISRQDSYNRPTPGYMRTKESGTSAGKEFARWMNLFTHGTDTTKGLWSPTGDDIDFLVSSITGPVVGSVAKTAKYIEAKQTGEEVPAYRVPVLGRFQGELDSKPVITSRFYNNINAMYEHELTLKNLSKDPVAKREYLKEHPEARAYKFAEQYESQINNINADKKKRQAAGRPQEQIDRLDNKKIILMNRFNDHLEKIRNQ